MKTRSVAAASIVALTFAVGLPAFNSAQDAAPKPDPNAMREQEMAARAQERAIRAQERAIRGAADAERYGREAAEKAEIRIRQSFPRMKGFPRHLTQIQDAAEKLRDAKDESDKAAAQQELTALVDKLFEADMRIREQELAEIAARLGKLRAQLERRRSKKQDIVDLQIKVAINEAEGLGFSSAPNDSGPFNFRVEAPVIVSPSGDVLVPVMPPTLPVLTAAPVMVAPGAPKAEVVTAPQSSDLFGPPVRVEAAIPVPPLPPSDGQKLLGYGAKGDAVRLLQKTLNEKLEPSPELSIDGDFGPETDKAVKAFQSENDLEETGVVDDATRKALELPAELPPFINN